MSKEKDEIDVWCNNMAALAVDVLLDCNLIKQENVEQAIGIVAEEILVRLAIGYYPPPIK